VESFITTGVLVFWAMVLAHALVGKLNWRFIVTYVGVLLMDALIIWGMSCR